MSPKKRRPQSRKGRTAVAARKGSSRRDRTSWIAAAVVVVIGASLVFAFASSASKKRSEIETRSNAPASLVAKVTGVSDAVITQVGKGTAELPKKTTETTTLTKDGKPRIVYIGAEYCPFCATERWAMVNAFSRFGTFKDLKITQSAVAPEAHPKTPTFSFYGSTFTSDYIIFEPVETATNDQKPLETPTEEQAALQAKLDPEKSIPFIDFANRYVITGASFEADVLSGKLHDDIADAMNDANSDIARGAIGTANAITAAICALTDDKPAKACSNPAIQTIKSEINAQ